MSLLWWIVLVVVVIAVVFGLVCLVVWLWRDILH
jgi:hypothetical protein